VDRSPTVVVNDHVAGDLMDPSADRGVIGEVAGVEVDAQHDLLQDVLGAGSVRQRRAMKASSGPCRSRQIASASTM
jgi:hypothetical protein